VLLAKRKVNQKRVPGGPSRYRIVGNPETMPLGQLANIVMWQVIPAADHRVALLKLSRSQLVGSLLPSNADPAQGSYKPVSGQYRKCRPDTSTITSEVLPS
jgi:hypothetical protein